MTAQGEFNPGGFVLPQQPLLHQVYQTVLHFVYANSKKAHLDAAGMTSSRDDREEKADGDLHDFLFRKSVN